MTTQLLATTADLATEEVSSAELEAVAARLETAHPREAIRWAVERYPRGRVAVVTGLQADGVAVTEMALEVDPEVRLVTIDTGRLPAETHEYLDTLRRLFGRPIEVVMPDSRSVGRFVGEHGTNAFYSDPELRLGCCHVRKVEPLRRVLADLDCWLTGLRRGHTARRRSIRVVERDFEHGGITKVNPLATWQEADTLAHLEERNVPLHPLYGQGYRSIGCAPCTRPVSPGEDPRAGRWWWEQGVDKECGIHGRASMPA